MDQESKRLKRNECQRRYQKRKRKAVGSALFVFPKEAEWLKARKKELGLSWLQLIYRGLGERREDVLNRIKGS